MTVRAKKHLGQHFLKDESIAQDIANGLSLEYPYVLEIGPGMGVLTKYLIDNSSIKEFKVVEIDTESVDYLEKNYPCLQNNILSEDFLKMDINKLFAEDFSIIGNFPYNISNQILFKVFENKDRIKELVGMFQKEVAQRVAAKEGSRIYGILSVLLSAYYDIEYLFTVNEHVFDPMPKVKSGVIRMKRNKVERLDCDEKFFILIIKTAFNQRRKMIRRSLLPLNKDLSLINPDLLTKRAEELSVQDYIYITNTLK